MSTFTLSKNRMPSPKTKSRATRRVTIEEKLSRIEKSLSDLRTIVNSHCGEQAIKTAHVAGTAAADEILERFPESIQNPNPQKKRPGPKLWNEFLKNYMKQQELSGRKLTRPQAMAEAGPNYRKKHGVTKKVSKTVQPTPGRVSPPKALNTLSTALSTRTPEENIRFNENLNERLESIVNKSPKNVANQPVNQTPKNVANQPINQSPNNTNKSPKNNNQIPNNTNKSPKNLNKSPNNINQPVNQVYENDLPNIFNQSLEAPESTNEGPKNSTNLRPNTTYYAYEDEGLDENSGARKVVIDGEDFFMTDQDRGLFKRVGEDMGEWVGYLEPGGHIRYTNSPANA